MDFSFSFPVSHSCQMASLPGAWSFVSLVLAGSPVWQLENSRVFGVSWSAHFSGLAFPSFCIRHSCVRHRAAFSAFSPFSPFGHCKILVTLTFLPFLAFNILTNPHSRPSNTLAAVPHSGRSNTPHIRYCHSGQPRIIFWSFFKSGWRSPYFFSALFFLVGEC